MRTGGEAYKRYGTTDLAFARNPYLGEILSPQQLRAFGGLPGQEQQDVLKRLNSGQFGSSDKTNATWQRFWEQLKAAGNYIETAFLNNLKEVAVAFTSLSKAVAEAIEKILQNKQFQEFLTKDLPNAIKAFTDYLTSPEFRTDLDDFFSAMKDITEWIISTLSSLGIVKDKQLKTSPQDVEAAGGDRNKADWVNVQRRKAIDRFMEAGVPKEVAIGLAANIEAESSWNTAASNKGHYGLGQWDKSRQKDFENWKGHKLETSTYAEQMDFFLYEMHNKEKNSWNEISKIAKKGGNYQDYTHAVGQFYERFGEDPKEYARRAGIAERIAIDMYVHQKPGTDVTVGTNTLAGRK